VQRIFVFYKVEGSHSQTIKIDQTEPAITIDSPIATSYLTSDSITIQYSASDGLSGIDSVSATLDGTPVSSGDVINLSMMAGNHTLNVVAIDKAGNDASSSTALTIQIDAAVDIDPNTFNLGSKSDKNAVTVYIEFPSEYNLNLVEVPTVQLNVNGAIVSVQANPTEIGDFDSDGIAELMVKFNREEIINALNGTTGEITISVNGQLNNGCSFVGSDTIKVISNVKVVKE
jgi:hypothetical protein